MSVYYEGGDGSSMDEAIVIRGTRSEPEAVAAEYDFISRAYGPGCMRDRQSLGHDDGRWFDILEVILPGGSRLTVYFDISEQFLGDLRARVQGAFVGNDMVLGALDAPLAHAMSGLERRDEGIPIVVKAAGLTAAVAVLAMGIQSLFGKKKRAAA
jgi:hypothetical protein